MSSPRERRRAPRARADFPIRLTPQEGAAPARLKDLSTLGLCCTTAQEMPELTRVGIHLQLPGTERPHTLEGAIVRCEPAAAEAEEGYEVAIYFTAVDEAAKAALRAYVAQGAPA